MEGRELKIATYAFIAMWIVVIGLFIFVINTPRKATLADKARVTVRQFGSEWEFEGPVAAAAWGTASPVARGVPQAVSWINTEDATRRLLVFTKPPDLSDGSPSSQWVEVTYEQVLRDAKWIRDGFERTINRDGKTIETETRNGVANGLEKVWSANGRLIRICPYVDGKREGEGIAWYENGNKRYVAQYKNDVEVSATSWNQDGSLETR